LTVKSTQPSSSSLAERPKRADALTRAVFDVHAARLEAAKSQNFSKETLDTWFSEFVNFGWTNQKLIHRYNAVLQMQQVRKEITFDDWLHAKPASGQEVVSDAKMLASKEIAIRKAAWIRARNEEREVFTEADLAAEGFIDLREIYHDIFQKQKEAFVVRMAERCDVARAWLAGASETTIAVLYNEFLDAEMIKPIGDLVEKDPGLLRKYVRDLLPMSSAKDEWIRDIVREYLKAEIVDILELVEVRMGGTA
jgi:hypothetical protein